MVDIARKNLFQERMRFFLMSGGVALAIMLILILNGFYIGMNRQITAYLDNAPGQLVATQKGLRNFFGSNSLVPLSAEAGIAETRGVNKVFRIFARTVVLEIHDRRIFSLMIGFDPARGGGPWKMEEGSSSINNDEVIFDRVLAQRHDIEVGERITILGKDFKVVGLSGGTSSWMTGTFFVTFDAASELLLSRDNAAFLFVSLDDPDRADSLKKEIARKVNLSVLDTKEMAENDFELFGGIFGGPLRLMVAIAFLIGVMLVGLTIYTATVERAKEYGVLKAVGMKNPRLYLMVFEQAVVSSVAGFIFGVALSFAAVRLIAALFPQFLIQIEWSYIAQVSLVAVLISLFASYVPVRVIARIDPAIAFRRGV
jgi:putative ABC transport system permease protein